MNFIRLEAKINAVLGVCEMPAYFADIKEIHADVVFFRSGGEYYACKVTKYGNLKKNSITKI